MEQIKELCHSLMINCLTSREDKNTSMSKLKEAQRNFFLKNVCEENPDCLVDACEFWLN